MGYNGTAEGSDGKNRKGFPLKTTMRSLCPALLGILLFSGMLLGEETKDWVRERKDIRIPMRDGKGLAADVYLPPAEGRYPAILIQTPYNKRFFGAEVGAQVMGRRVRRRVAGLYDREHYAYVIVDWRGFYGSKGAALGIRRPNRGEDGYDCVEWIAKQPWSDGKVGTWGGSALGKQQFDTAAQKPPHLVCCVPLIACMGQMYEFYYAGGVYREAHVKILKLLGYSIGNKVWNAPLPNQLIWRLAKKWTYKPESLDVPLFFVTGWWDHFPDEILKMFEDVRRSSGPLARKHSKILIGPWTHMDVDRLEQGDLTFPDAVDVEKMATCAFFDYWLRGKKENGWDKTPVLFYYQVADGEGGKKGNWMACEEWPGVDRETRTLHLHADGAIREVGPGEVTEENPLTRTYRYDPSDPSPTLGGCNLPPLPRGPKDQSRLEKRSDVLVYAMGPLSSPLRILGNVEVTLHFTVNRVDADFTVRLCDVHPEGAVTLIHDGIQRVKFRDGGRPQLLDPGKGARVTIRLPKTAYTVARGHGLKVLISSSNHPRFERNSHTGADHWDKAKALDLAVTIHHDKRRPSTITLPLRKE
jgi:predicted acyl esterase